MNINKLKEFKNLIFLFVILILIIANYYVYNKYASVKNAYDKRFGNLNAQTEEQVDSNEEDNSVNLKDMEERDRMEYYFSEFIDNIEEENYQASYDLLHDEFKERYFPTLEKFTEYVKKTYSDSPGFQYNNIERQGNIYVLTLDIVNYTDKTKNRSQRIVIKENDFDDFVISFQVI